MLNKKNEAQNTPITSEKLNELDGRLIKMQNSFLNPNDDFGTLKKGVVIDNLNYEYEVGDKDDSNFTIKYLCKTSISKIIYNMDKI